MCAQGCPFDIRVCIYAADAGQLEALRYAVGTAGQTVNTAVLYAAAAKDNLACLTYMVEDLVRWSQLPAHMKGRPCACCHSQPEASDYPCLTQEHAVAMDVAFLLRKTALKTCMRRNDGAKI